jgi:hypothetical protein
MYPYIIQGDSLLIVIDGRTSTINRETHPKFDAVLDAIRTGDWDAVPDLVDLVSVIRDYTSDNGDIEVRDGDVYFQGKPFANALADRMLAMLEEELPIEPLCNFLTNLKKNPSKRAVDELYGFLENNMLPLTPDGHFVAYKKVRGDYTVGQIVEMARNEVDEDKDRTCSSGLHFCSLEYLPHFGGSYGNRVVLLKINPRDVVSIPSDYNNAKGRCCRYEVIGEHNAPNRDTTEAFDSVLYGDFDDGEVREVKKGSGGWSGKPRYWFPDTGEFATREDYLEWLEYRDSQDES